MKYAWIERNKLRWPVCVQCRVLSVSASGYRQHLARRKTILTRRHLSETALLVEIRAVYAEAHGAFGWPRVWRQLKAGGVRVGKRRVPLAMRRNGIRARGKRRSRVPTTDSNHALPIAPNLLARNFTVARANAVRKDYRCCLVLGRPPGSMSPLWPVHHRPRTPATGEACNAGHRFWLSESHSVWEQHAGQHDDHGQLNPRHRAEKPPAEGNAGYP
jgi:hypothetical protein